MHNICTIYSLEPEFVFRVFCKQEHFKARKLTRVITPRRVACAADAGCDVVTARHHRDNNCHRWQPCKPSSSRRHIHLLI
jgi:hypothetical protein